MANGIKHVLSTGIISYVNDSIIEYFYFIKALYLDAALYLAKLGQLSRTTTRKIQYLKLFLA